MQAPDLVQIQVETQARSHNLKASAWRAGPDLLVCIHGGERPHLGAVAMATPRPSLADPALGSATTSVFAFVGHKEDGLAQSAAQALASALGVRVVVTAGCHWEGLDQAGIDMVRANSRELVRRLLEALGA